MYAPDCEAAWSSIFVMLCYDSGLRGVMVGEANAHLLPQMCTPFWAALPSESERSLLAAMCFGVLPAHTVRPTLLAKTWSTATGHHLSNACGTLDLYLAQPNCRAGFDWPSKEHFPAAWEC